MGSGVCPGVLCWNNKPLEIALLTTFLYYSILPYPHNDTRTAYTSSTSFAWEYLEWLECCYDWHNRGRMLMGCRRTDILTDSAVWGLSGFERFGSNWIEDLLIAVLSRVLRYGEWLRGGVFWSGSTLYWTQREVDLVLCVSRLWIIIVVRTEGMWTWVGMKDCELNWSLCSVCRTEFVAKGELVGCEELTRLLQKT